MGQEAPYVFQEVPSRVSHLTKESDVASVQSRCTDVGAFGSSQGASLETAIGRLRAARVRVPDLHGEELEEAIGRAFAGGGDKSGRAIRENGDKVGHELRNMYLTPSTSSLSGILVLKMISISRSPSHSLSDPI